MSVDGSSKPTNFTGAWIGNYHFLKRLDSGAFATVYLADECFVNRKPFRSVAIKVFTADLADRPSFHETLKAFEVDLQFLADVAPENPIVQYYSFQMSDVFVGASGIPETADSRSEIVEHVWTAFLLVMEYADGGSLGDTYRQEVVVRDTGRSHLDHFIDVCTGLKAAHAKGVIHRDIKPQNLMWLRKANKVKIGDFGIARLLDQGLGDGVGGTPPYMSPESFDPAIPPTAERDIYALGCTFFELITGQRAFNLPIQTGQQLSMADVLRSYEALHRESPRPAAVVKSPDLVSVPLSGVIQQMMSLDPAQRASLDDVIDALVEEKQHARVRQAAPQQVKLPASPVYLSPFNINPLFLHESLKQSTFFVFIRIQVRSQAKYKALFGLLEAFFYDSYSISEVYGRYDFLIRVSCTRDLIQRCCERTVDEVLEGNRQALYVMACEQVEYLGAKQAKPKIPPSAEEVLVHLNVAQTRHGDDSHEAVDWLRRAGIYVRDRDCELGKNRIRAFSLVSHAESLSQPERRAKSALIVEALSSKGFAHRRHDTAFYRRSSQPLEGFEYDSSDYLISYVVDRFDDLVKVPSILLDDLTDQRLRVATMLATKRYYVDSDRCQRA